MKTQDQQAAAIAELKKYYPELSDNLQVDGDLCLSHTPITTLPDNLCVGGYLNLRHTQITILPNNLHVGGRLDLYNAQITTLPDNLQVGGNLCLTSAQITTLPDNLQVGGKLNLYNTSIKSSKNWIISNNIGSRKTKTSYSVKDGFVRCGCFKGTIIEFENKVHATYPEGHQHRLEYDAYIDEIKTHLS